MMIILYCYHKNPRVVINDVINLIEKNFGRLTITRGKEHEYLGMKLVLKDNSFEISMKKQIQEAFDLFGEEISGIVTSPCARHLFETQDDAKLRTSEKKELFHMVTAKLLYTLKRE